MRQGQGDATTSCTREPACAERLEAKCSHSFVSPAAAGAAAASNVQAPEEPPPKLQRKDGGVGERLDGEKIDIFGPVTELVLKQPVMVPTQALLEAAPSPAAPITLVISKVEKERIGKLERGSERYQCHVRMTHW